MELPLEVSAVEKRFGRVRAVRGLGLALRPGDIFGLIGPDGAGKTTAMRVIAGLLAPDQGEVRIAGIDVSAEPRRARERMGYMPQQYSLYGDLSVIENLRFFAGMYGVPRRLRAEREGRLLRIARLDGFLDRPAAALSGGMYKKLALACALIHQPAVLLLDEPTNGVDPISRRELWAFLAELAGGGVAVLVSTPYMDEAERCCRVGLMIDGTVVTEGTPEELRAGLDERVFELRTSEPERARELLSGADGVSRVYSVGRRLHVTGETGPGFAMALRRTLEVAGLEPEELTEVAPTFEDVFLAHVAKRRECHDDDA
jgi:ABC-2 type transport system ATP-binding protein